MSFQFGCSSVQVVHLTPLDASNNRKWNLQTRYDKILCTSSLLDAIKLNADCILKYVISGTTHTGRKWLQVTSNTCCTVRRFCGARYRFHCLTAFAMFKSIRRAKIQRFLANFAIEIFVWLIEMLPGFRRTFVCYSEIYFVWRPVSEIPLSDEAWHCQNFVINIGTRQKENSKRRSCIIFVVIVSGVLHAIQPFPMGQDK